MKVRHYVGILAITLLLTACGNSSSGGATAKLQFSRTSRFFALNPLQGMTDRLDATVFKMKLIAAYLTEDIAAGAGNNVGQTSMIYLNPVCEDDIMHCDIAGGTAEDGNPISHIVTDFFDFSSTDAANTALNAQGLSIQAGTYKYARLEFCKFAAGADPNIEWDSLTSAGGTFKQTSCTVNSAELVPPVTVAAGGSVTVTLTYSLVNTVANGTGSTNCNATECFTLPNFIPSATTP